MAKSYTYILHSEANGQYTLGPTFVGIGRRCCTTLTVDDSHCESMRLDKPHEQAITRPLPHHELVQLYSLRAEAWRAADPLPGNACLHA